MILTIIITAWVTTGIIHVSKEWASPYARNFMLLNFIFSPMLMVMDTISEWREWKEIMRKE